MKNRLDMLFRIVNHVVGLHHIQSARYFHMRAAHHPPRPIVVQYLLSKPLCLVCDDAELLEAALRTYQGRALYEGTLPESALLPLCGRYGLLI